MIASRIVKIKNPVLFEEVIRDLSREELEKIHQWMKVPAHKSSAFQKHTVEAELKRRHISFPLL